MPPINVAPDDRDMMIRTVIGEADDQPAVGQAAVAHTIMNRVSDGRWGDTPSDVVLSRGQFEPWKTRARELMAIKPDSDRYQKTAAVVDDVLSGKVPDPTGGATHFLDPELVRGRRGGTLPDWAKGSGLRIGDHAFFRPAEMGPAPDGLTAINHAIGGGAAPNAMAYDEPQEDLIGEWMPKGNAPQASGRGANPAADEDLVREWMPAAAGPAAREGAPQSAKASSGAMMPVRLPPHPETMGEAVARMTGEAQGDTYTDMARRLGLGAVRGVGDVADTLAQGIAYAGEKGAGVLQRAGAISPETAKSVTDWRSRINADIARENAQFEAAKGGALSSDIGRLGGQIAGTGPFLAGGGGALAGAARGAPLVNAIAARPVVSAALRGAGAGAGANLLTSSTSDEPLGEQLQGGALAGAVGGPVGRVLGRIGRKLIGSGIDTETANLAAAARDKFGIPLRADQISANPMVRFMGSVMQRMPFTGLGEHVAEQQAAANRAIASEMGQVSDKVTPQTILAAKADLGQRYESVNRAMGPIQLDRDFVRDVRDARDVARMNLEPSKAAVIENHIDNIGSKIDPTTGTMTPEAYQHLLRHDGPLDKAINGKDTGGVGQYATMLKKALEAQFERSDPALAKVKKDIDYRYWVANAVEPLAHESTTGDISMAKLLRAADLSTSDLGQLGRVGQRFLKEPPSSGTAERLALMKLGLGLGAGAAGIGGAAYFDPEDLQKGLLVAGTGALGAKGLGWLMKRPELTNMLIRSGQRQQALRGGRDALQLIAGPAAALVDRQRRDSNALAATP
jgi:Cell Wall Hydrolase